MIVCLLKSLPLLFPRCVPSLLLLRDTPCPLYVRPQTLLHAVAWDRIRRLVDGYHVDGIQGHDVAGRQVFQAQRLEAGCLSARVLLVRCTEVSKIFT